MRLLNARYIGRCWTCDSPIMRGDVCGYESGRVWCRRCATRVMARAASADEIRRGAYAAAKGAGGE